MTVRESDEGIREEMEIRGINNNKTREKIWEICEERLNTRYKNPLYRYKACFVFVNALINTRSKAIFEKLAVAQLVKKFPPRIQEA
jgi:hypothetical protein